MAKSRTGIPADNGELSREVERQERRLTDFRRRFPDVRESVEDAEGTRGERVTIRITVPRWISWVRVATVTGRDFGVDLDPGLFRRWAVASVLAAMYAAQEHKRIKLLDFDDGDDL